MALQLVLTKGEYEKLPDAVKEHYKQDSEDKDSYVLDTDDAAAAAKIREFRTNNIKLLKEKERLQGELERFKDIDPDRAREAMEKLQSLEDEELIKKGDLEGLFEKRTERMRKDHENQMKALQKKHEEEAAARKRTEEQLSRVVIDSEVQSAVSKVGTLRQGAMTDVLSRARSTFRLKDGQPVPMGPDESVIYGADGKTPMSITEWAESLLNEAPYLFEGSKGGGAGGTGDDGTGGVRKGEVKSSDRAAFSSNLEKIAKGEVRVVPG